MIIVRYLLIFIIIFMSNFSIVKALEIEDKLNELSENIVQIEKNQSERNLLNKMYPVGSIYMTMTNVNPSSILGGTWERYAQGRTLIGVDNSSYTSAGLMGGKAIKTISTSNMASHNHNALISGSVSSTFKGSSVDTSSNNSHLHTLSINSSDKEAKGYVLYVNSSVGFGGRVITYSVTRSTSSSAGSHNHTLTPAGTVSSTFYGSTGNTTSVGSNSSINFQNPYITIYIWKRTS